MGLFDGDQEKLQAENRDLKREIVRLNETLKKVQADLERKEHRFVGYIDRVQGTFLKIRELSGCLEATAAMALAWEILASSLGIERGGLFTIAGDRLTPVVGTNLPANAPSIPLDEDSLITWALEKQVTVSSEDVRKNQELAGLERRGAYPDTRLASPFQVRGAPGGVIVIGKWTGRLFSQTGEIDLVRSVASILGLSLTNAGIVEAQQKSLDSKVLELEKVRGIFARMVSPDIIRTIEANPNGIALGGRRQPVVIMFIDIRGFTHLSETLAPERLVEMLNQYFSCITDIIIRSQGTLDKFIGDAVMALFNTPVPIKDPALRAFGAAIRIQKSVQALSQKLVGYGYPPFSIGIGLNFQEVVAGMIGSTRLSTFTVIGDGVNVASRLCSVAGAGEISIGKGLYDQLRDWSHLFEAREGVRLKGKEKPVTIFIHRPQAGSPEIPLPEKEMNSPEPRKAVSGDPAPASVQHVSSREPNLSLVTQGGSASTVQFRGEALSHDKRPKVTLSEVPFLDAWTCEEDYSELHPGFKKSCPRL